MWHEIKGQLKVFGIILLLPIIIPLVLLFVLVFFLIILPLDSVENHKRKRKLNSFLQENDCTYFFIYSSGRKKASLCEKHILPTIAPGVKVVKFDGLKFDSFFIPEVYYQVINPSEKGYPLVGKIEEGKVYTASLKEEFSELVLNNKNKDVNRFLNLLHLKMEAL
ncbi:hypothetical protein [Cesiribacter sp. SM1]|uniref:hypothetical protein n=1 Tax=Cesiribacter sp. SM1 TaxID=2861196 RepID=UPI001CD544CB|nr:hypothetical protein [Cesiribacter sp. SM1]